MRTKTRNWLVGGAAVLAFGGVLSLFQDDETSTAEAKPKPSATESAKKETKPEGKPSAPAKGGGIPSPDPAQRAKLISALSAVDPGLTAKEDRAVSRARDVCLDIKEGKDAATVQTNTKMRFDGIGPSVTYDQAADIVSAVKSSFCG